MLQYSSEENRRDGMACARALVKYGEAAIVQAYTLNRHHGEGARTIAQSLMRDVFQGNTRGADCAINAGWYLQRTAYTVDYVLACFCADAAIRSAADARNRCAVRQHYQPGPAPLHAADAIEVRDATLAQWADAVQVAQWAASDEWKAPTGPDTREPAPVHGDD